MHTGLLEKTEYKKNRFKIKCTYEYFSNGLDHSQLNKHHNFIDVVYDPSKVMVYEPRIRLTYAKDTKSEVYSIPVRALLKNGQIILDDLSFVKYEIEQIIEKNYLWQIEIVYGNHLYVLTAPKLTNICYQ